MQVDKAESRVPLGSVLAALILGGLYFPLRLHDTASARPIQNQDSSSQHTERAANPPVILISVDTLRPDHLSCFGYKALTTPHIDRLASGGTLFSAVSSQVPLTLPSHVSLLTSTYPFANGVEDNGEQLAPNALTLAGVFKSHGYRTA